MTRGKKLTLWLLPLLLILALIVFAVLAPVKFLNSFTPSGSYTKTANIAYGELPRHRLDVYSADKPKAGAPMLVFIHGGGWRNGDKVMYKFLAEGFTKDGYDMAVANYRLYPDGVYPNMLLDTAKAVRHVAETYPERPLVLMGHSAGAYNVLMMGLAPYYLRAEGVDLCGRVAGVISLAGPTGEIKLTSPKYVEVIPDRFNGESAVINNLDDPNPPILIVNGGQDTQVDPKNATGLAARMMETGKLFELKLYGDHTHNDLVKYLSRYFEGGSMLKADLVEFIDGLPREGGFCE